MLIGLLYVMLVLAKLVLLIGLFELLKTTVKFILGFNPFRGKKGRA